MSSNENVPNLSDLGDDIPFELEDDDDDEDSLSSAVPARAARVQGYDNIPEIVSLNVNFSTPSYLYDDTPVQFEIENEWDLLPQDQVHFQSGSSSGILMDLATNEKHVHADFYNDFDDLFDDDDDLPLNSNN